MGKNKALAHHTSFRVFSYASCVDLTQLLMFTKKIEKYVSCEFNHLSEIDSLPMHLHKLCMILR